MLGPGSGGGGSGLGQFGGLGSAGLDFLSGGKAGRGDWPGKSGAGGGLVV